MDQKTSAPSLFLRRMAGGIVTARWVILILTLAAMVFCAFSSFWVQVDSSLASFLAEDAEVKTRYARRRPYRRWVEENRIAVQGLFTEIVPSAVPGL